MSENPYETPQDLTASVTKTTPPFSMTQRLRATVMALTVGLPLGGISAYVVFAVCVAIGSSVIADETWNAYEGSIFTYGILASFIPSLISGSTDPRNPVGLVFATHCIGVILAAFVAGNNFRWPIVMATYFVAIVMIPIVVPVLKSQSPRLPSAPHGP